METAHLVVRIAQLVIFGALALVSLRRWRAHRDEAAKWWTATVGVLAVVTAAGFLIPENSESDLMSWVRKVLVAVLVLFPYFLFQYGRQFVKRYASLLRAAQGATAVIVVWTFFLPRLGGAESERTTALNVYVVALLVQWTALSVITTVRLWRAGRAQPAVVRRRMRTMAFGAALLNLALFIAAFAPPDDDTWWPVFTGALAIVCAAAFFVGFMPPRALRVLWRSPDAERLREAEMNLMAAVDPIDIGSALLPDLTAMFGAKGSVLVGRDGEVIVASGLTATEARAAAALVVQSDEKTIVEPGLLSVRLRNGWLAVRGQTLSPFFSRDELDVLVGLGAFTDLALDRAMLFEAERAARRDAERANSELETFVYSVSHDLKSPLVSLLGFLDYLSAEIEAGLSDEGRFFLQRISAASLYMQALIQDLLELSRIGRVQTEAADVDLNDLVNDIAADQQGRDGVRIEVDDLPVVCMNPLRARQLFTNLINNAISHSGRPDVTVTIGAMDAPDGGVVLFVADDGKGIPAGYREKVFGVFERLERQENGGGGTGIGLAVCRKIIEQCGGHIEVADNRPGARFSIRLPADAVRRRKALSLEAAQ